MAKADRPTRPAVQQTKPPAKPIPLQGLPTPPPNRTQVRASFKPKRKT